MTPPIWVVAGLVFVMLQSAFWIGYLTGRRDV